MSTPTKRTYAVRDGRIVEITGTKGWYGFETLGFPSGYIEKHDHIGSAGSMEKVDIKTGIKLARLFIRRSSEIHIPSDDHLEMVVDIVEGKTCCGTCASFSHLDGRCLYGVEKCYLLKDGCCEWTPADTEG